MRLYAANCIVHINSYQFISHQPLMLPRQAELSCSPLKRPGVVDEDVMVQWAGGMPGTGGKPRGVERGAEEEGAVR